MTNPLADWFCGCPPRPDCTCLRCRAIRATLAELETAKAAHSELPWQPAAAHPTTFEDGEEMLVAWRDAGKWRITALTCGPTSYHVDADDGEGVSGDVRLIIPFVEWDGEPWDWDATEFWCPLAAALKGLPECT